jgi:hypothetical protein
VWLMNSLHQSPYRWVRLYEKFPQSIGTTLRETALAIGLFPIHFFPYGKIISIKLQERPS